MAQEAELQEAETIQELNQELDIPIRVTVGNPQVDSDMELLTLEMLTMKETVEEAPVPAVAGTEVGAVLPIRQMARVARVTSVGLLTGL